MNENILNKFIANDLPHDEMVTFEHELFHSDNANSVFHTIIQDYLESPDINDLIGPDDQQYSIFEKKAKIFDEKLGHFLNLASNVVYNHNNYTYMNNINFSKDELNGIAKRYESITQVHNDDLSLVENLSNAYLASHPDATIEDAKTIAMKLLDGCETLTRKFNESLKNGFFPEKELEVMCANKSVEERFSFLVNALAFIENANLESLNNNTDIKDAIKKSIDSYNEANPNPTIADCEALQKILAEAIVNNNILLTGSEKARELIDSIGNNEQFACDFAAEQYNDSRLKAEMALAAWIEYENGNIKSIEQGAMPEAIAVGVATAIEETKIMNDVASGKTKADIAVKCLKILGGIALVCILGYLSILACSVISGLIAIGLMSILGTSVIATIASIALTIPILWGMAELCVNGGAFILEKAGTAFDVVIDKLRNNIIPKIKDIAAMFINWVKSKFSKNNTSSSETVTATT